MEKNRVPELNEASDLSRYSCEHLTYEIKMLMALVNSPIPERDDESVSQWAHRMAGIESFGLHLRNLIEFFYPSANGGKGRNNDVMATDFLSSQKLPLITEKLKEARERANKELVHLTTARQFGIRATKTWRLDSLDDLKKILSEFAEKTDGNRLSKETKDIINQFMKLPVFSELDKGRIGCTGPSQRNVE
jgi:hypothetical protein